MLGLMLAATLTAANDEIVIPGDAPPSWAKMDSGPVRVTCFSDCVNGALEHHDWKDLLK